jgi:hypothetical protein
MPRRQASGIGLAIKERMKEAGIWETRNVN